MKTALYSVSLALALTSCAVFTYGTGRLNPIYAAPEAAFRVTANATHYVALSLPPARVAAVLPAPAQTLPANTFERAFPSRTVNLRDLEFQPASLPSGWTLGLSRATLALETSTRSGVVTGSSAETITELDSSGATLALTLRVPANTPSGAYTLEGRFVTTGVGSSLPWRVTANVVPPGANSSASGTIRAAFGERVDVVAGGAYTLEFALSGFEAQRLAGNLTRVFLATFGSGNTNFERVRSDGWNINPVTLPPRWELEVLETTVVVTVARRSSSLGWNQIRSEYTLSYGEAQLLLGLRAVAATPAAYSLRTQLEYRGSSVQAIQWTVSVQP